MPLLTENSIKSEISGCQYCGAKVVWSAHREDKCSHACNLDRKDNSLGYTKGKDNSLGYTKGNVVVSCWNCNIMKGSRLTYEEMMLLSPALKQIVVNREAV
jgi:5-methylcytosine-specific restriction endonuclease McrA